MLVFTDRLRAALAFAFVGCELGLAATMRLGAFPFVMVAALLLFLPPRIWDRLEAALKTKGGRDPRAVGESIGSRHLAVERAALPSVPVGRRDVPARTTVRRLGRVAASVVLVCFLVAVVTWQLAGAGFVDSPTDVDEIEEASWSFFAPNPPDASWWYAWEADLEGGETVGTLTDESGEIDRPPDAADTYPSVLWKRYGTDLRYGGDAHYEPLADYRCRRVADDSTSDGEPETVRLYHVEQPVTVDGPVGDPVADLRLERDC